MFDLFFIFLTTAETLSSLSTAIRIRNLITGLKSNFCSVPHLFFGGFKILPGLAVWSGLVAQL